MQRNPGDKADVPWGRGRVALSALLRAMVQFKQPSLDLAKRNNCLASCKTIGVAAIISAGRCPDLETRPGAGGGGGGATSEREGGGTAADQLRAGGAKKQH